MSQGRPGGLVTKPIANTSKFGNDSDYESPIDTAMFIPMSSAMVEPCFKIGLTPNKVTTISKIFEGLAILLFLMNHTYLAALSYIVGYTFDCVDGKLARGHNMSSNFGMMYDFNSDVIAHGMLYSVFMFEHEFSLVKFLVIFGLIQLCNVYYGFIQAITNYKKRQNDDFYGYYEKMLVNEKKTWFLKMFMNLQASAFTLYRVVMPVYNDRVAHQYMKVLKYFGPGTIVTMTALTIAFDLMQYITMSMTDLFMMFDYLNYFVAGGIAVFLSVVSYDELGSRKKYVATPQVHYMGLLMGFVMIWMSNHVLPFMVGWLMFTFHVMYHMYDFPNHE